MSEDVAAIGGDTMEPELVPGQSPSSTNQDDDDDPSEGFESSAPAVPLKRAIIPRTDKTRAALAEAINKFKTEKAESGDEDEGDFGSYDEGARPVPKKVTPGTAAAQPTNPAAIPPPAVAAPAPLTPPAPSLDPEVTRLRAELAQQREALTAREQALASRETDNDLVGSHDEYLESPPKSYRRWLETMRGEKLTDDEFKTEVGDFVTAMSADVLGVALPDVVRAKLDAQLAKKSFRAIKEGQKKRDAAETARREKEQLDTEWSKARDSLNSHFRSDEPSQKAYAWLVAEDNPGAIVVDVIQSAQKRDGTVLSWQEASKRANDYLQKTASGYFDKRKHLLNAAPAPAGEVASGKEARPGRPPGQTQVTRAPEPAATSAPTTPIVPTVHKPGSQWSKEAHRRQTRAAFANVFKPEE